MPAAYGLTTDSPLVLREYPIGEYTGSTPRGRGGAPIGRVRNPIRLTTEEEVDWIYRRADRRRWSLAYRAYTTAQLEFFAELDAAIGGDAEPWYFCPDINESPQQVYLVRMDEPNWLPNSQVLVPENGIIIAIFQIQMNFTELSESAQILL